MEYQNTINFLENTPNQPSKFWTKNLIEVKDNSRVTQNTNSQIIMKTTILMSSLCDYTDGYILDEGPITVPTQQQHVQQQIMAIKK